VSQLEEIFSHKSFLSCNLNYFLFCTTYSFRWASDLLRWKLHEKGSKYVLQHFHLLSNQF